MHNGPRQHFRVADVEIADFVAAGFVRDRQAQRFLRVDRMDFGPGEIARIGAPGQCADQLCQSRLSTSP